MLDGMTSPSLSDIAAVTGGNNGFFGNEGIWAVIILAIIFGWGGNGNGLFGNSRNSGVTDGYILTSDFSQLSQQLSNSTSMTERKLDGIANGICSLGYDQLAQMNGINQNVSNVGYNLQTAIVTNGYDTRNAIQQNAIANMQSTNALSTQLANCCCENEKATMQTSYNLATESCATRQAIADAKAEILGYLTQDKLATLTAENQALKSNAYLVSQLRPSPIPAYTVSNPYCNCGQVYNGYYGTTIA